MNAPDESRTAGWPRARAAALLFAPPLAVGLWLRLQNVSAQVLGGDELHTVRLALSAPVRRILERHTEFDHGRPLTALFRLLIDAGVVVSELTFRAPALLAGALLLVVAPRLLAGRIERGAAVGLAWLLALSPVLVLYSRMVRTYMPVLLFAFVAVMAFHGWWEANRPGGAGGRHALGAVYALAAALAVWAHLLVAPFVLAPLLFAAGDLALDRRARASGGTRRTLVRWLGLFVVTGVLVALPWTLATDSLTRLAETRGGRASFGPRTWLGTLTLQAGSPVRAVVLVFWAIAVLGAWIEARRRPRFFAYAVTLSVLHVATIVVLAPKQSSQPLVFDRYVLVLLPFVLAWIAVALAAVWNAGGSRRPFVRVACVLVVAGWYWAGPLAGPLYRTSPFTQHNRFVDFSVPKEAPAGVRVPEFYRRLAAGLEPGPVLEFPWNWQWNQSLAPYYYQEVHGRDVVVAGRMLPLASAHTAMRNVAPIARPDGTSVVPESFLASRARYAVVHLDMALEELRFQGGGGRPGAGSELIREDGARMADLLRQRFGPPLEEDGEIAVWDLEAARAALPPRRR